MRPFEITFNGKSWTDEQVTSAHVISVAELCEVDGRASGFAISPFEGPRQLAAWIVTFLVADRLVERAGSSDLASSVARVTADAIAEVYAAPADLLLGHALVERVVAPTAETPAPKMPAKRGNPRKPKPVLVDGD